MAQRIAAAAIVAAPFVWFAFASFQVGPTGVIVSMIVFAAQFAP